MVLRGDAVPPRSRHPAVLRSLFRPYPPSFQSRIQFLTVAVAGRLAPPQFNGQAVSPDVLLHTYEKRGGKDKADEREIEGEADMLDYFGDFDEHHADFIRKFEDTDTKSTNTSTVGTVCTLMLLEELGGPYLHMGRRVPHEMRYVLCPLSLSTVHCDHSPSLVLSFTPYSPPEHPESGYLNI